MIVTLCGLFLKNFPVNMNIKHVSTDWFNCLKLEADGAEKLALHIEHTGHIYGKVEINQNFPLTQFLFF